MKQYVVVGGSSGIGAAISAKLQSDGHEVTVLARESRGTTARFESWDATSGKAPIFSPEVLDGIVYCPGTIQLKPFHRITDEEFLHELQVNALGAARLLRHFLPALKKAGNASAVLFSTVAVQTGMPFHASIAMAKGAVEGLVRSLAAEWAPFIRVNALAPSLTQTPLAEKLTSTPEKIEASNKRHPLGRIGQPSDLAEAACFLLYDTSAWMTGQVMHVDGGMGNLKLIG
jgi:3-oxoacyl-[acyl-carrier protein] reductase